MLSAAVMLLVPAAPAPAAESANSMAIEEVVVTARKKDESILTTPISITAVTGEQLEAKGIVSFNALADATPGVTISNVSSGRSDRSFQQITLRGFVPSSTSSTLTATFIDGVPVASPSAVAVVTDPARIEILKGPQAAYFGRNTFAGAINVVNKTPGHDLAGSLSIMGGTRSNTDLVASLEGPLVSDNFGFRIGAHVFRKDGSYNNAAQAGQTLGDQATKTFSLLLTGQFTDNFSSKLFLMFSRDNDGPSTQGMLSAYEVRSNNGVTNVPFVTGNTAGTVVLPGMANCTMLGFTAGRSATEARVSRPYFCGAAPALPAGFSPAQNTYSDALLANSLANGQYRIVTPSEGVQGYGLKREFSHAHLNLDWKLGDSGFTLSSLTGLNDEYYSEIEDLDNYNTALLANPSNPGNANPNRRTFWDFVYGVERKTRDFSQELRVAYDNGGAFSGVLGASYLKTTVWNDLVAITTEIVNGGARVPQAGKSPVGTQGLFFGATYKFNDAFKLTAEGRYQTDEVKGYTGVNPAGLNVTPSIATQFGLTAGFYGPLQLLVKKKYNNFLPRVIAQWDIQPGRMAYVSYSKGVNVGTNTFNTSFLGNTFAAASLQAANELGIKVIQKPEKLTNYEVGFKGKFLDGQVQLQAAVYRAKWTDQLNFNTRIFATGGTPATEQVTGYANTGDTNLTGVELEVTARAAEHLDVSFAAALNDSSIQSYVTPSVSQITGVIGDGFKGKQLPQTAKYSANLGVQYNNQTNIFNDANWFARVDLSWKDKQYVDAANLTWIKARSVVNLRTGIASGAWAVDAFVLNAFNDKNYTSIAQNSLLTPNFSAPAGNAYLTLGLPELRTYGARVSYKF